MSVPTARKAVETPGQKLKSWQDGIGPAYLSLYLLIVFFDRLGPYTLAVGGLGPSLLGAAVGGVLAFTLLYHAPAMWGLVSRRDLATVAGRTFGAAGGQWVPGLVLALVQVVWFAVAIYYSSDLTLKGMMMAGLIEPRQFDVPQPENPAALGGPVFLITISVWMASAALLGPLLVKIVAAILFVYTIVPTLALSGLMLWSLGGLAAYEAPATTPVGAVTAFWMMVQLVFAFTATAGLMAVDWGAASRSARDVRLGGLVGVGLAPLIVASVTLVTIIGALGHATASAYEAGLTTAPPVANSDYIYHRIVIQQGIGGVLGCTLMIIFALALLGPACYGPSVFCRRFAEALPRVPRWAWSLVGVALAWPLVATGLAGRLPTVFGLIGAMVAPIVGAMAADYVRDRGRWPAPRRGVNPAGWLAWLVGLAIGLLPYVGPASGFPDLERVQPAAVLAFVAAFLIRIALGWAGLETADAPVSDQAVTEPAAV